MVISQKIIFATSMYKVLRRILFFFPPESVHYFSMNFLKAACQIGFLKKSIIKRHMTNSQPFHFCGLTFKNRVGLGAGFDKNALYLKELEALGFGFVEIGTVTPKPQSGNEQPRLFRLPEDKALINRMGFNNDGVKVIAQRLKLWNEAKKNAGAPHRMVIGGNIGKNKTTANDDAWKDYETCFNALYDEVDYFVVNVSSPNTPGLRALQEKDALRKILEHLQMLNNNRTNPKPLLLKIAPDLSVSQLDDVIDLALEINLDGIVATNTTLDRSNLLCSDEKISNIGAGGLSGRPLFEKAGTVVRYIFEKTNGKLPIIGSGGIFTGTDAWQRIKDGASLVQVWTGFVYEGPAIVKNIHDHINQQQSVSQPQ